MQTRTGSGNLKLENTPNWILHKGKRPINIHGSPFSITKDTPYTYEEAFEVWLSGIGSGLGFVLKPPFVGIDIDNCMTGRKETFGLSNMAYNVMKNLDSYTEVSYSGNGIHIIAEGEIDRALKTPKIEIYGKGRYFTVTGFVINGHEEVNKRQDRLDELVNSFRNEKKT